MNKFFYEATDTECFLFIPIDFCKKLRYIKKFIIFGKGPL